MKRVFYCRRKTQTDDYVTPTSAKILQLKSQTVRLNNTLSILRAKSGKSYTLQPLADFFPAK